MTRRRLVGLGMIAAGLMLLALKGAGHWIPGPPAPTPRDAGIDAIPGYDFATRGSGELLGLLEEADASLSVRDLNERVYSTLAHGEPPPIRVLDSWVLWLGGAINEDLRLTQHPRRLASGGRGICSDAVLVLNAVLRQAGYRSSMIDLGGHVIAEVHAPDQAWVADPDFGVVFHGGLSDMECDEGAARIRSALRRIGHDESTIEAYVTAATSVTDNRIVDAGVLNPRLWMAEQVAGVLDWILPVTLACCGLVLMRDCVIHSQRDLGG